MKIEDSGWATIESAPRNGSRLILWATKFPLIQTPFAVMGRFDDGLGWVADPPDEQMGLIQVQPSHWLPLPPPPSN